MWGTLHPDVFVEMGRVIYQVKAFSVVVRIIFLNAEKNWFEIFEFWSNFELRRRACRLKKLV